MFGEGLVLDHVYDLFNLYGLSLLSVFYLEKKLEKKCIHMYTHILPSQEGSSCLHLFTSVLLEFQIVNDYLLD